MATTTEPNDTKLARRAVRLEWLTISWNTIECVTAVTAGLVAGSVALTGFGFDSAIETASALVVLRHLLATFAGRPNSEAQERRALRFIAGTFFVLAAYIVVDSTVILISRSSPETTPIGIAITAVSLFVMPVLARAKLGVGRRLENRLLIADARETQACVFLSARPSLASSR